MPTYTAATTSGGEVHVQTTRLRRRFLIRGGVALAGAWIAACASARDEFAERRRRLLREIEADLRRTEP
ncbi:MAG: hypothetical protein OHK0044_27690 [Burkholderiaceae bacterium]